jgi:ribosomal protein S20
MIVLFPALTLVLRELAGRRTQRHTEQVSATDQWLGQFNAIRGEWDSLRKELSRRVERAEEAELECEKRCAETELRVVQVEADRVADRKLIHQQREELTTLQMEAEILKRRLPNEDGPPQ